MLSALSSIANAIFGRWARRHDARAELRREPYRRILRGARELEEGATFRYITVEGTSDIDAEGLWLDAHDAFDKALAETQLETSEKVEALAAEFRRLNEHYVREAELLQVAGPDDELTAKLDLLGAAEARDDAFKALLRQMKRETGL